MEFFLDFTTLIGTDTTAPYSLAWSNIPAGSHFLTAQATDNTGASTTSDLVSFYVNLKPEVSITSSPEGDEFTVPQQLTIAAAATDADGTISKVEFFDGATYLGTDYEAPYNYKWRPPAGTHSVTAKAWDDLNATTVSQPISIAVNPMPIPTGGFTCPGSVSSRGHRVEFHNIEDQYVIDFAADNSGNGLSPCEQITFKLAWMIGENDLSGVWLDLYNFKGEILYSEYIIGVGPGNNIYPSYDGVTPWTNAGTQDAIPAYALLRADFMTADTASYDISYARQPRRADNKPYNLGGDSFANAAPAVVSSAYHGSLYGHIYSGSPVFDPINDLPADLEAITRVDRGFTPTPDSAVMTVFEDFTRPPGTDYCDSPNECIGNITVMNGPVPNHDESIKAGIIRWMPSGSTKYFQSNWEAAGSGRDVSSFQTLDFRVSRTASDLNPSTQTNFSVQLVMADGGLSTPLSLCQYHRSLKGPVGGLRLLSGVGLLEALHPILETVRIPLSDFTGADLSNVRGVRFLFDEDLTGAIYLANIRFTK